MRVSRQEAALNREKIAAAASRLFREHGISATGVDAITAAAGLTHGAVYSRFGSKEAIATQAIRDALSGSAHLWRRLVERHGRDGALAAIVAAYLSPAHRDMPGTGCVVAALGGEIARQPRAVREAFTAALEGAFAGLADLIPAQREAERYDQAISTFAAMVGGLIFARVVSDDRLSVRILRAVSASVTSSKSLRHPRSRSTRSRRERGFR